MANDHVVCFQYQRPAARIQTFSLNATFTIIFSEFLSEQVFFSRVCVDDNYSEATSQHLLFPSHKYLMMEKNNLASSAADVVLAHKTFFHLSYSKQGEATRRER